MDRSDEGENAHDAGTTSPKSGRSRPFKEDCYSRRTAGRGSKRRNNNDYVKSTVRTENQFTQDVEIKNKSARFATVCSEAIFQWLY